jgi:hypothetical protein
MWFIIGLILGAALLAMVLFLRTRNLAIRWYEWLIGSVGLLMLLITILNFTGSLAEHETFAAWTFLWLSGVPSIILIGISLFLPWRRHSKS